MPNLSLRVASEIAPKVRDLLPRISALTATQFGAPHPNVMLVEMSRGPETAAVYAELLYLDGKGRGPDKIRAYAQALADILSLTDGRLAFRGMPVAKGQIVSLDVQPEPSA